MKTLSLFLIAAGCLGASLLASCNKDSSANTTDPKAHINQIYAPFRFTPERLSVTAGTLQTVTGSKGTKLVFYPNSFKRKDGTIVSAGLVQLQLTEMYTPGAMIANRATTTNGGNLLISGGQVYLTATLTGEELTANKFGIGFVQAAPSGNPMALFYGNNSNQDSVIVWIGDGYYKQSGTVADTVQNVTRNYYMFDSCSSFNWINCDFFYNSTPPLTDVNATIGNNNLDNTNTQIFMVFPAINSVTYFRLYNTGTHTFSLGSTYAVPAGMTAHVITMGYYNGTYYYDEQKNLTLSSGMSLTINPVSKSIADIQTAISNL